MDAASNVREQRLVLFDLDNTLIDRAEGFTTRARQFAATHSSGDESEVEWLGRLDNDGLTPRADVFAAARECYGLLDSVQALLMAYQQEYPQCMPPLPTKLGGLSRTCDWPGGRLASPATVRRRRRR